MDKDHFYLNDGKGGAHIAGTSHRRSVVEKAEQSSHLKPGKMVLLVRDKDNTHDPHAIAVYSVLSKGPAKGRPKYHIGFLPKAFAGIVTPEVDDMFPDKRWECAATIRSSQRERTYFRIWIDFDLQDAQSANADEADQYAAVEQTDDVMPSPEDAGSTPTIHGAAFVGVTPPRRNGIEGERRSGTFTLPREVGGDASLIPEVHWPASDKWALQKLEGLVADPRRQDAVERKTLADDFKVPVNFSLNSKVELVGIYSITNKVTNAVYIGESVHVSRRWKQHFCALEMNVHHNHKLQSAFSRHGSEAFFCQVIEVINPILVDGKLGYWQAKDILWERERFHIQQAKNQGREVYNLTDGGPSVMPNENPCGLLLRNKWEGVALANANRIEFETGELSGSQKTSDSLRVTTSDSLIGGSANPKHLVADYVPPPRRDVILPCARESSDGMDVAGSSPTSEDEFFGLRDVKYASHPEPPRASFKKKIAVATTLLACSIVVLGMLSSSGQNGTLRADSVEVEVGHGRSQVKSIASVSGVKTAAGVVVEERTLAGGQDVGNKMPAKATDKEMDAVLLRINNIYVNLAAGNIDLPRVDARRKGNVSAHRKIVLAIDKTKNGEVSYREVEFLLNISCVFLRHFPHEHFELSVGGMSTRERDAIRAAVSFKEPHREYCTKRNARSAND